MQESLANFETGPYLQTALFCERVLDEKDNVKSFIRVIDRLQVTAAGPDAPDGMPEFSTELNGVLAFKSGQATGPVPIKITLTKPSGITDPNPVWEGTVHFEGGTRGHNLILRIHTRFTEPGPYWFNVYVGSRLATKMPFEIIYTTRRTQI